MITLEKVPAALCDRPQWVLWKTVQRGDDRPTKLPFQTNGTNAKSNDESTWTTFAAVDEVWSSQGYDGPGFVFSEADPFCGIDLDGCRDPKTGVFAEWAKEILKQFNSYSEVSPSGTGVKIFIEAKLPFSSGRKVAMKVDKVCDKEPAVEIYDRLRYFAVTGLRLATSPNVEQRQDQLDALCLRLWPEQPQAAAEWHSDDAVLDRARKYMAKCPPSVSGQKGHDTAFHAACVLLLGFGLGQQDGLVLLREWNQTCQPPWSERELSHKIESASKQGGPRNYLRLAKPENYSKVEVPRYVVPPQIAREVKTTTLLDAAVSYIDKLASGAAGAFELGLPDLDYAVGGGFEFGEMVIIAARPGHGKSAVALQAIHNATLRGLPSIMISEEMSSIALGKRCVQFATDVHQEYWIEEKKTVVNDIAGHFASRAPCYVAESCGTALQAADVIRKHVEEKGVKFAVVDYAQLLKSAGKDRYEQVTNTSLILRQLTNDTKVILFLLAQLNRSIESRQKFIPVLSDLKDTGQLEQDADVLIFVVWPFRIDGTYKPREEYKFFIAKNRNRAINQPTVNCIFNPVRQKFLIDPANQSTVAFETGMPVGGF